MIGDTDSGKEMRQQAQLQELAQNRIGYDCTPEIQLMKALLAWPSPVANQFLIKIQPLDNILSAILHLQWNIEPSYRFQV